jgi:hypothetical protein
MDRMRPGRKRAAILAGAVGAVAILVGVLLWPSGPASRAPATPDPGPPRLTQELPHPPPPADPVDAALTPVPQIMAVWRSAILSRNADEVLASDAIFLEDPGRYREALVTSAQTDSEGQVRAFSTRVLGKFKDRTLVPAFRQMLLDQHRYVRENAAWALGEMQGREAARDLARLARNDPADNVRAAAVKALEQMNAGVGRRRP